MSEKTLEEKIQNLQPDPQPPVQYYEFDLTACHDLAGFFRTMREQHPVSSGANSLLPIKRSWRRFDLSWNSFTSSLGYVQETGDQLLRIAA